MATISMITLKYMQSILNCLYSHMLSYFQIILFSKLSLFSKIWHVLGPFSSSFVSRTRKKQMETHVYFVYFLKVCISKWIF